MTTYHKVLAGEIVETREFPEGSAPTLAPNKGAWLPEILVDDEYDPDTHVREGPTQQITSVAVLVVYSLRPKTSEEVDAMIAVKLEALETEYRRRNELPFLATVDGVERLWHGDREGMDNVEGINVLIARDPASIPNPRAWKPYEADLITVSHDGFLAIGLAYAARKDSHFVTLQTKKGQLRAMTDPADVAAFDPLADWF